VLFPVPRRNSLTDHSHPSAATIMLPTAGVNQVFGLLDLVKAYNGKTDVANLNIDLRVDVDELLPIIDTAEYMGLVTVEQGDIALTETGRSLLNSRMQERKKILRERLRPLEPFTNVTKLLSEKKELSRIDLGRFVNQKYAYVSDLQRQVRLIISWGVFTGIFRYDGESSKLMSELKASS